MQQSATQLLIRFMRLASEAATGEDIVPLLADAAVDHVKCDAAAIVEVREDGAPYIVESRGLPELLAHHEFEADVVDSSLGAELAKASGGEFAQGYTRLMVSSGGLFGALVLLFRGKEPVSATTLDFANALADAAAIRLDKTAQFAQLAKSNADLRASQEALARSEKLRALGQMASGIVHDLKNILNPLLLHLQLAQRALGKGNVQQVGESLDEMNGVVRRGVETLERLRDFSRQAPERAAERADLSVLAREAAEIAKPRMAARSNVRSVIREELRPVPTVSVHASEVVSAIVNLVVNAIDAMPDGGTITLRTGEEAGGVWVQVGDDGPGMPPDIEKRVFEPFFTTKGQEGTGLGLAMVYACVQRHGGRIGLKTAPGEGACFTLWFPAAPK